MSNNTFYDAIKKRKPSAQELYYMQLLGRPLTPDEMSFPSTITKNDKGVPIISFQNWVKQGGDLDSLLKRYGYLPECSEKQSQSHASKTRKSDKPFENKYSKEANPDALWLSCRLGRKLEGHEVLYARQINEDDQGRPINWPSPEKVKQMFFPDPPKKTQAASPSVSKPTPKSSAQSSKPIQTQSSNRPFTPAGSAIFGNKHLTIECTLNKQERLESKFEGSSYFKEHFQYAYDAKGHLERVYMDGKMVEEYGYNDQGQRIKQVYAGSPPDYLRYNSKGQLVATGDVEWEYDKKGALSKRLENSLYGSGGYQTHYFYGADTKLDKMILPNGGEVTWKYGRGEDFQAQNPLEKYKNGKLVMEYEWQDPFRLAACLDHIRGIRMDFSYGEHLWPQAVHIFEPCSNKNIDLLCGCDQVGSLKLLTSLTGNLVKRIRYDSFGNVLEDSYPELHIPIGFASGLVDEDTGLVRFGYRDYDPSVGRFTCPDPLGDTGGDHDPYDYCVDDPVTMIDYTGLKGTPAASKQYKSFNDALNDARGIIRASPDQVKDLGSGIAYGGLQGAGYLFDLLTVFSPNKPDVSVGREFGAGVTTVWPMVEDVIKISTGRTPGPWGQQFLDNVQSGVKRDFNKGYDRFQNKPESK